MTDERGRPWRHGHALSRAEAEALARRWLEGDIISEAERYYRDRDAIFAAVEAAIADQSYDQLNQIRAWMVEQGMTTFEESADPKLVQQVLCEEICQAEVISRGLKGPDMDVAYWECMHQCAPITYPETLDPADPLYPHSDPPKPDEFTTTYSLPPGDDDDTGTPDHDESEST